MPTSTARQVRGGRHGLVAEYLRPPISAVEVKAGQRLGVDPEEVRRAAGALWERSLAEERDARLKAQAPEGAPARTIQALRGHITRSLLRELDPTLKRQEGPKPRSRGKP